MPAVSISALAAPIAIVHIPVNKAGAYDTELYWAINKAVDHSEEFFNVTSNRLEIAVFASVGLVERFWRHHNDPEVRISKSWRVFDISSGDQPDTGNYDSPHLRYVSAPLAQAGISILYQSSYFTDFLLVKEEDFDRAASIFASQGWRVHNSDPPPPRRRSGLFSPAPSASSRSSPSPPPTPIPSIPQITVLPSPIACVGFARSSERACDERLRRYIVWPERCLDEWRQRALSEQLDETGSTAGESSDEDIMERPFISYTRNEYGSSLVTEVKALRGMFPPGDLEELEVQCAGELSAHYDELDDVSDDDDDEDDDSDISASLVPPVGGLEVTAMDVPVDGAPPTPPISDCDASSPDKKRFSLPLPPPAVSGDIPISWTRRTGIRASLPKAISPPLHVDTDDYREQSGRKRCLQLDLRGVEERDGQDAYHLDKSGLVTLFSDLLDSAQIRILYSSTFHTANVLVEAADISRARQLLKRGRM